MANRYSSYPSKLDKLKILPEFQEMSVQQWKSFAKWNEITSKGANITQSDINELNTLLKNDLRDVQLTSTDWNLLCGSVMNLEDYVVNHIFPDISKMVNDKENEFTTVVNSQKKEFNNLVNTKTSYFNTQINSFQDMGIYNNNRLYNKNNFVHYDDGSGSKVYIALKDTQGATPSNDGITWRLITIKGDTGENGKDGLNLVFKGEWDANTNYKSNQTVLYRNDIFISMKDDNINNSPKPNENTTYWHKWKQIAVTSSLSKGVRKIVTQTRKVQFTECGDIHVFNPNTDILEVHCNTTVPIENVDYRISQDNQFIEKIDGYWNGTKEPIWFEFVVKRNQINDLVFSDGQSIANKTISKNKLSQDVQDEINSIKALDSSCKELSKELKENTTKNITKETNIVSLTDNVDGIANISLGGNTVDIAKDPIISDFKGKTQGDTSGNPNIAKLCVNSKLQLPSENWTSEFNNYYKDISSKDDNCNGDFYSGKKSGEIPQQLFSFNIVEIIERKIGKIQGNSTQEKVAWLKKNTKSITCNWWGYGSCPNGSKAYLKNYDGGKYGVYTCEHSSNTVSKLIYKASNLNLYDLSDGFMYFTVYTDASNGTTTSTIYTDYINLEVQLNPILRSVGEEDKEMVVKSVGKNLINNDWNTWQVENGLKTEILQDGSLKIINSLSSGNTFVWKKVRVKPNANYYIKVETNSNTQESMLYIYTDKIFGNFIKHSKSEMTFNSGVYNEIIVGLYSVKAQDTIYKNLQLEEGTQATQYEPYQEDKVTINLLEPLKGLPNGTRDTINSDGSNTIRVGKVVLNGSEKWCLTNTDSTTIKFSFETNYIDIGSKNILCNEFIAKESTNDDSEGANVNNGYIGIRINKSKLSTQDVQGFKKWLSENPTTVYYETNCILTGNKSPALALKTFEGGHIIVDTEVAPFINISYPSNINSRLNTVENATSSMKDSLGGAWRTLLMLADKELKMHSISKLTTTDALSKKINEIIGVW